jgi:hypothetical protein
MIANTGKYIKFFPRDPWRPGTKIIHHKPDISIGSLLEGVSKEVFHPPKDLMLSLVENSKSQIKRLAFVFNKKASHRHARLR